MITDFQFEETLYWARTAAQRVEQVEFLRPDRDGAVVVMQTNGEERRVPLLKLFKVLDDARRSITHG